MGYDSPDTEHIEAQREDFKSNVGDDAITSHGMVAIKDGFPPGKYAAINPGAYAEAIASGQIEMRNTLFAKAQVALEDAHGPANAPQYAKAFGASAAAPERDNAIQEFDMDMRLT